MTTLQSATSTLLNNYDRVLDGRNWWQDLSGGDTINRGDLERLVSDPDPSIPQDLRDAAQFLLDSDVSRNFLDVGAGKGGVDGRISREDLQGAMKTIKSGAYYDELLDTAAGRGGSWNPFTQGARDGKIGQSDIEAALLDPGVPPEVKDALRLAQLGDQGLPAGEALAAMTPDGYAAASALYRSPEFAALSAQDRQLVAEAFRDGKGDLAVSRDLQTLIQDPSFKAMTAEQRTAALTEFALRQTPEFKALSPADQRLVLDTLSHRAPGDTGVAAALKHLIESGDFQALSADEQTAALSQARNYPDTRAISNIERLAGLDWFQDMSLADKQRTLKTIAFMSTYDNGGDRTTLDNTLEKLLAGGYSIEWTQQAPGVGAHSNPGSKLVSLNINDVPADNNPVGQQAEWQIVNATPHEINHAIDDVHVAPTYEYLDKEYQAYVTGFEAQNGRPMTRQEAAAVWRGLLDPNGVYGPMASRAALADPAQAAQIFAELSRLTGVQVNAGNYQQVLNDPGSWNPPETAGNSSPIPADARPQGNTDNH